MRLLAALMVVVSSWSASAQAPVTQDAVTVEEQAFAAIDNNKWCLAMRLFERAHELGPAAGLLQNAARAAELGGDLDGAVRTQELIETFAGSSKPQRSAAIKKVAELKKQIATGGAGAACPSLAVLQPPVAPVVVVVTEPEAVSEAAPRAVQDRRPTGAIIAGVGGGAVLIGAATSVVGLLPWFAHADALQRVLVAERDKGDASSAQADQQAARGSWESYGRPLTLVAAAVMGAGVAVAVGGLAVALLSPAPGEEP